jgi:hypothetical protein
MEAEQEMEPQQMEQIIEMLARFEEEMMARMDANHEEMMAMRRAWRQTDTKDNEEEAMACEEKTEVRLGEVEGPASVDMKPEVADEREAPLSFKHELLLQNQIEKYSTSKEY